VYRDDIALGALPATPKEFQGRLGCSRRTAQHRLKSLRERRLADRMMVGRTWVYFSAKASREERMALQTQAQTARAAYLRRTCPRCGSELTYLASLDQYACTFREGKLRCPLYGKLTRFAD
jgi:predicted transcriptional regulator